MEAYYSNQASNSMPHFSGNYRQRGSGFGALAAGIGCVALPLARRVIFPAAKKIGRELIVQGAPEILEVATKKKSAKHALKSTVKKTAKKQIGGSLQRGQKAVYRKRSSSKKTYKRSLPMKRIISQKANPQRSLSDLFSKVKNAY